MFKNVALSFSIHDNFDVSWKANLPFLISAIFALLSELEHRNRDDTLCDLLYRTLADIL
jgi:hypothetical protein